MLSDIFDKLIIYMVKRTGIRTYLCGTPQVKCVNKFDH